MKEQGCFADVRLADYGSGLAVAETVEDGAEFIFTVYEFISPHRAAINKGMCHLKPFPFRCIQVRRT